MQEVSMSHRVSHVLCIQIEKKQEETASEPENENDGFGLNQIEEAMGSLSLDRKEEDGVQNSGLRGEEADLFDDL